MYIFDKTYTPSNEDENENEEDKDEVPGLGDVSDNNPYKPWGQNMVSKITLIRKFTDDNTENKIVYLFQYDKKSRIIEYTEEIYNTTNNTVAQTNKFNFTYDDSKVYLYYNGELMNYGIIGTNGYLSTLYEGNSTTVNSTFKYDNEGYVTYLKTDTQEWEPTYDYEYYKNMTSPTNGSDELSYLMDIFNLASVDLNGLTTTGYQWEWFMHYDYSGVVLGLFDFYGKRSNRIANEIKRGIHWTDNCTNSDGINISEPLYGILPTMLEYTRTGLNNPFVATYEIEYYE